jgi:hypothetical protein
VTFTPVFCTGCWAWGPVAFMVVVCGMMQYFLVFLLVLYTVFAVQCSDILTSLLEPISNDDSDTRIN